MSLIGDALRKARQEAAERDSDRKGVLFSAKIADRPQRSNLGLGLILGALIAIVATVGGGLAVWWLLGGDRSPNAQAPVADATATIDTGGRDRHRQPTSGAAAETPEEPSATDRAPDALATTDAAFIDPDSSRTTATPIAGSETATDSGTTPISAPESATKPQPETGFLGREDDAAVYLMEADLGDVTLALDYIVFRGTDPYVEINGVEVHIGGTVSGFRVKSVERDRVTLSDGRRNIVLRTP